MTGSPYVIDQMTYSKVLMHGSFVGLSESLAAFRLSDGQWSITLAEHQYRQVVGYHQALDREQPGVTTWLDRAQGRLRARFLSFARRSRRQSALPQAACR